MIHCGKPTIVRLASYPASSPTTPNIVSCSAWPADSATCCAGDTSFHVGQSEKLQDTVVINLMQTVADLSQRLSVHEALDGEMKRLDGPPPHCSVEGTPVLRLDGTLPSPRQLYHPLVEMVNIAEIEGGEFGTPLVPKDRVARPLEGEFQEALQKLTQAQARLVRHIHHHGAKGLAIWALIGFLLSGLASFFFIRGLLLPFHLPEDEVVRMAVLSCVSFALLGACIAGSIGHAVTRQSPLQWESVHGRRTDAGQPHCQALSQADLNLHGVLACLLEEERAALLSSPEHRKLRDIYAMCTTEVHAHVSGGTLPSPTLLHVVQQAREQAHAERHLVRSVMGDCWL